MSPFKVTAGVLHIGAGVRIVLSPAQAAPRAHNLERTSDEHVFVAKAPLQFKTGEIIGVEPDAIAKSQRDQVAAVEQTELALEPKRRR